LTTAFKAFVQRATKTMPVEQKREYLTAGILHLRDLEQQLDASPSPNPNPIPAMATNSTKCPSCSDGEHQWKRTGHGTLQGPYCMNCNALMHSSS
jgi:hypothetical protein